MDQKEYEKIKELSEYLSYREGETTGWFLMGIPLFCLLFIMILFGITILLK